MAADGVSLPLASTRVNDRLMGGIERRKVPGRSIQRMPPVTVTNRASVE